MPRALRPRRHHDATGGEYVFESFRREDVAQQLLRRGKRIEHGGDAVAEIRRMNTPDATTRTRHCSPTFVRLGSQGVVHSTFPSHERSTGR